MLGGDEHAGLEVISHVTDEAKARLGPYLQRTPIETRPLLSDNLLDMIVTVYRGESRARVRIADEHTNVVLIERNGEILLEKDLGGGDAEDAPDTSLLTVERIYDFACTCDLDDVRPILDRQIECNTVISIAVFWLFRYPLGLNELVANGISWVIAVLFAFFTNRIWVFRAPTKTAGEFLRQMASFYGGRVVTLLIEEALLAVFITWLGFPDMPVKITAQIVVIVLNYVISKLFVFKKEV